MHPSTLPHPATPPVDEDLADQARPGYGIPSQDPRPGAQTALEPEDAGALGGAAAGTAVNTEEAGEAPDPALAGSKPQDTNKGTQSSKG